MPTYQLKRVDRTIQVVEVEANSVDEAWNKAVHDVGTTVLSENQTGYEVDYRDIKLVQDRQRRPDRG